MDKRFIVLICLLFSLLTSFAGVTYFAYPGHYYTGGVLLSFWDQNIAKDYFEKSISILEEQDPKSKTLAYAYEMYNFFERVSFSMGDYLYENDKEKAFEALEKAIEFSDQIKITDGYVKSLVRDLYSDYAIQLENRRQFKLSETYYQKAIVLAEPNGFKYFHLIEDLGVSFSKQNRNQEAIEHYMEALDYYKKVNDAAGEVRIYNLIAYNNFK